MGEIALLDQRPRTATVVATTPVSVEVLSQREFVTLLAEAPELSEQIMATMAKRLADIDRDAIAAADRRATLRRFLGGPQLMMTRKGAAWLSTRAAQ